jgi:hypothetical protein
MPVRAHITLTDPDPNPEPEPEPEPESLLSIESVQTAPRQTLLGGPRFGLPCHEHH